MGLSVTSNNFSGCNFFCFFAFSVLLWKNFGIVGSYLGTLNMIVMEDQILTPLHHRGLYRCLHHSMAKMTLKLTIKSNS